MIKQMKRRKISLTDKFIMLFIAMGVIAAGIVSGITYYLAKDALMERTFDQLTSVKSVKKRQMANFFQERRKDIRTIRNVLVEYDKNAFSQDSISFLKQISKESDIYNNYYIFTEDDTEVMQSADFDFGNNQKMKIQALKKILKAINFQNETEEIAVREIVTKNMNDKIMLIIAALVKDEADKQFYLVLDINIEAINRIMLENSPGTGLGKSGESYLVGEDLLMRSSSRFQKNTIMNVVVDTRGTKQAFKDNSNTDLITDYRGIQVLSSFSKLGVKGIDWAILAEIDLKEALAPIENIRNYILFLTVSISLIVFIIAYIISKKISKPLMILTDAAKKIGAGDFNIAIHGEKAYDEGAL